LLLQVVDFAGAGCALGCAPVAPETGMVLESARLAPKSSAPAPLIAKPLTIAFTFLILLIK